MRVIISSLSANCPRANYSGAITGEVIFLGENYPGCINLGDNCPGGNYPGSNYPGGNYPWSNYPVGQLSGGQLSWGAIV